MYPQFVEVDGKQYKINTDYRVAIECNRIAEDGTIGKLERSLAIIYMLYGDEGIDNPQHYEKLLSLGRQYLLCGKEFDEEANKKPDMDFDQDYGLIWTSIYSEYNGFDIDKEEIHWWRFNDMIESLSNSELGNCCALNRTRNYRNIDPKTIKDAKTRKKVIETQKKIALKKYQKKKKEPTQEQRDRANELLKQLGIERK